MHSMHAPLRPLVLGTQTARINRRLARSDWVELKRILNLTKPGEEIDMGFFFSGTHCKGVSKQLCVYHLYRNVFLAETRIRSHLGCISSFQYPQSNRYSKRVSKRLSRAVAFIIDLSVSRVRVARKGLPLRSCIAQFHPKHNAFKGVSKLSALRLSTLQKRVSGSNAYQISLVQ